MGRELVDPPKWCIQFLRWICHEDLLESVEGDLFQLFQEHQVRKGRFVASLIYLFNTIQFMQPFSFSNQYYRSIYQTYVRVILRGMKKRKTTTALNVFGMFIAILIAITIFTYVSHELSYDRYHKNSDRIYRLTFRFQNQNGYDIHWARMNQTWINQLPEEFPEVEQLTRFQSFRPRDVTIGTKTFRENHAYAVDKAVFKLFDFERVHGNLNQSLDPYTVVLTNTTAQRYFGESDPVGETIRISNDRGEKENYVVTAVIEDLPSNTHLPVTLLTSINSEEERQGWAYTYILLQEGSAVEELQKKLPEFIAQNQDPDVNGELTFTLQPMADIHLNSHLSREIVANGDVKNVFILVAVAIFLLLIASVNFINLNTIQSLDRVKELGLRKCMGAPHKELKIYLWLEALILSLISALVALIAFSAGLGHFEKFIGYKLVFNKLEIVGLVAVLVLVLSSVSMSISNQLLKQVNFNRIINWLTSSFGYKDTKKRILQGLQFCTVLLLISSMIIMHRQFNFMAHKKLGYNKEQLLVLENNSREVMRKYDKLKSELEKLPGVKGVTSLMQVPSTAVKDQGLVVVNGQLDHQLSADIQVVDINATEVLEMEFAAGEGLPTYLHQNSDVPDSILRQDLSLKDRAYLINETAAAGLGWENPEYALGQEISWTIGGITLRQGPITGVVRDFHQESLKEKVRPLIMTYEPLWSPNILVKMESDDVFGMYGLIESYWQETFPGEALELSFLDQELARLYLAEKKQLQLISAFTFTAIFIAFLGLYAMIAYTVKFRLKELAIRKVLGSDWFDFARLLSKEYLLLAAISMCLVFPATNWIMSSWLSNYAYRISINGTGFLLAGVLLLVVILLALLNQVVKSSTINPASLLKSE